MSPLILTLPKDGRPSADAYLTAVITRIVEGHPQRRLDDLLPWAYLATPSLKAVA